MPFPAIALVDDSIMECLISERDSFTDSRQRDLCKGAQWTLGKSQANCRNQTQNRYSWQNEAQLTKASKPFAKMAAMRFFSDIGMHLAKPGYCEGKGWARVNKV
ncbi:MAG: hypothetical protein MUC83_08840 [Pirellula sp.]|nr:hypothetical protein [Pirellula sp.]